MTFFHLSTNLIASVYKRLFLNQCYVCNIRNEGTLCLSCQSLLSNNRDHCQLCSRPSVISMTLCGECQATPPSFDRIIAPLRYEGLCRGLIRKAKFENQPHLLRPLVAILANHLLDKGITLPDTWCVVPTSQHSLSERGYCQTSLIFDLLRQSLGNPTIKRIHLQRRIEVSAQHTRSKQERQTLSHRFFDTNHTVPDHVLLIDDIVTTGSTVEACAKALRLAGAKQVTVLALARTPE